MIRLSGVSKRFPLKGGGAQAALSGIDLEIATGEVFGIIGPSGSGKSTLIRLINRLERPDEGRVEVAGIDMATLSEADLSIRRHKLGMIFQQFGLLSSRTARQNVLYALDIAGTGTRHERKARADALLAQVGLTAHADKYPAQLSGGQKQRVAIARALANAPDILLCDEATSALDPESTRDILDLIAALNCDLGLTVVLVTHEMEVVRRVCDRVAVLDHGHLAETGTVAEVLFTPKSAQGRVLSDFRPPGDAGLVRLTWQGADPVAHSLRGLDAWVSIRSGQVSALKSGPYGDVWADISGPDRTKAIDALRLAGVQVREAA
ncbi:methionine ABC transporter ATP-binding protein [Asticcacaulis sp. YBE204]|uniref:methionine ABC transporter ATP-binding protein n=1 Tax=Asticcacaulis sp. YBE204 TaxID=1282363 RepID=UPI0003C3E61A|nr:methionine ABC transporter ATP-binding protein [Asticcacaulis sp. YBE204]ESQ77836.1 hypothetical protein AEYBE204_17050 [Asticcacaulis sp. YBE204]